jgi:prepilin-type N-terminal cleavage/methylation domain-containing protein
MIWRPSCGHLGDREQVVKPASNEAGCCFLLGRLDFGRSLKWLIETYRAMIRHICINELSIGGPMKREEGFSLLEIVIAIAILGILAVGFLGALRTGSKTLSVTDERQTAKTLAQHQMEYVKLQGYLTSYSPDPASAGEYPGYTVAIYADSVPARDGNIQKIRVIVSHQGRAIIMAEDSTLEGYKVY